MYQNEYLESQVMTATPHQLHLMVVDGAIRFANVGKEALLVNNYEDSHLALSRSRDFISEIFSGLDDERAPEMIESLRNLFAFSYKNLAQADIEHKPELVDDAIRVLELHKETWMELIEKLPEDYQANAHQKSGDWER
ncbi:MAG: flagellar export chaperone FliS [Planctomycetaceae bacterium]|nr:flagellar export chaperone FliS [Planctomycetaceae bacterium]